MADNTTNANKIFSVEEIFVEINKVLGNSVTLSGVRVKGEISGYTYYKESGHIYFDIIQKVKNKKGQTETLILKCNWYKWKNQSSKVKSDLKNGAVVTVFGNIQCYNVRSQVNIIAEFITLNDEVGKVKAEYEKRKKEFEEKGYFEKGMIKRPKPKYPRSIGIITSDSGKAIGDIEATVNKKNPYVQLYLVHTKVQGAGAAEGIVRAIKFFDKKEEVDIIIIGRGGGGDTELTAFDEPEVVKAVYECQTYIISGTGHTANRTLADYAVDNLSNNPTDAAYDSVFDVVSEIEKINREHEKLVTSMDAIIENYDRAIEQNLLKIKGFNPGVVLKEKETALESFRSGMSTNIKSLFNSYFERYRSEKKAVLAHSPANLLDKKIVWLDSQSETLSHNMQMKISQYENRLQTVITDISKHSPMERFNKLEMNVDRISENMSRNVLRIFETRVGEYDKEYEKLVAFNPAQKLVGGFGYVTRGDGEVVANVTDVAVGDEVKVKMHDGVFMAKVTNIEEDGANG